MPLRFAAAAFCLLSLAAAGAERGPERGLLLREGTWDGGVGTFQIPAALEAIAPERWPLDGWSRLTIANGRVAVAPVAAPSRQRPAFLDSIVSQVAATQAGKPSSAQGTTPGDDLYLRVPVALAVGASPAYVFRNGTTTLRPELDRRYELRLGAMAFAFTVENGRRTANGTPYGSGALYVIEYGGERYEYLLGEFGWDSTIEAIADLDGDGKPDFIVRVAGNNSDYEAVLLSSQAKPGINRPTASLIALGC